MRGAILQLNASDDPKDNLGHTLAMLDDAVRAGAEFVLTPEVTNCVSTSRKHQQQVLMHEKGDITLAALSQAAPMLY